MRNLIALSSIFLLAIVSLLILWPSDPDKYFGDVPVLSSLPGGNGLQIGDFERRDMRLGLDLQGGTRLLLQAEVPQNFDGDLT